MGIYFIGPLPPRLTGQSFATQRLLGEIKQAASSVGIQVTNVSGGLVRKVFTHLSAGLSLLVGRRGVAYISVNANAGMWLTIGLVAVSRLRGHHVFMHHHTRSRIRHSDTCFRLLVTVAGEHSTHITICEAMSELIRSAFPAPLQLFELSNVSMVDAELLQISGSTKNAGPPYTLGHMSNLTLEKGLGRAVDAFRLAKAQGTARRLILAGPISGKRELDIVEQAKQEFGNDFEWRGRVEKSEKIKFFNDIDLFLFPSLYSNETQGIVNLEALAAGVPVAAFGICCIPGDLDGSGSCVVDERADYPVQVARYLRTVPPDIGSRSRERYRELVTDGRKQIDSLIATMLERATAI